MSAKATRWNDGTVDFVVRYGRVTELMSILSGTTTPRLPANRVTPGSSRNQCRARKEDGKKD